MRQMSHWIGILGLLVSMASAQSALAATCTSVASNGWTSKWTWSCNRQPQTGDTVVIAIGTNVLVDAQTKVVGNVTINSGGVLTGQAALSLSGNLANNGGTFTAGGGLVSLVGTAAQSISGPFAFADLTLTNLGGVTIAGNVSVAGIFTPGVTPISIAAGSTLTVNGVIYSGPCAAAVFVAATYCGGGTAAPVLGAFDAFEMGGTVNGPIKTHVEGKPFKLDVVAIKAGAIDTAYTKRITVTLVDASAAGFNCATALPITATISPGASTSMKNGKTTYTFTVPDAYKNLQVQVDRKGVKTCPNDHFAVRPDRFTVPAVTDAGWGTQGVTRALGNLDANVSGVNAGKSGCQNVSTPTGCAGAIHKAGQPFLVTATAVDGAATPAPAVKYVDVPVAVVCVGGSCSPAATDALLPTATVAVPVACTGTACVGAPGAMMLAAAPPTAVTTSGVITAGASTYSEVGAFTLQLQDQLFADVDKKDTLGDCSATGRYICSDPVDVGRFVPDHFDTVVTDGIPCPPGMVCTPASGFTYSGQAFVTKTIARNAAGNNTENYNGALAKDVTLSAWDAATGAAVNPGPGGLANPTVPAAGFTTHNAAVTPIVLGGEATVSTPVYTFTAAQTAPAPIRVRADDVDGVTSLRATLAATVEGQTEVRSGRIKISNAHGTESLPLPMTVTVQYYGGNHWLTSATDSTTAFHTGLVAAGGNVNATIVKGPLAGVNVQNANANPVAGGVKTLTLAKPGAAGSADISLNAPAYLLAGSNGAGVNPSKAGRATFGVYKGNNNLVYLREAY